MEVFSDKDCDVDAVIPEPDGLMTVFKHRRSITPARANAILAERGRIVFCDETRVPHIRSLSYVQNDQSVERALLIPLEPIVRETAEDVLRDFLRLCDDETRAIDLVPIEKRARAVFADKGDRNGRK